MTDRSYDNIRAAIQIMFNEFETLSIEYDEFTDTDVREAIHRTLTHYFVWGANRERMPISYGMRTAEGDARIREAIALFLKATAQDLHEVPPGQSRLDLLQNQTLQAAHGMRYYELLGHRDEPLPFEALPEHMFIIPQYPRYE